MKLTLLLLISFSLHEAYSLNPRLKAAQERAGRAMETRAVGNPNPYLATPDLTEKRTQKTQQKIENYNNRKILTIDRPKVIDLGVKCSMNEVFSKVEKKCLPKENPIHSSNVQKRDCEMQNGLWNVRTNKCDKPDKLDSIHHTQLPNKPILKINNPPVINDTSVSNVQQMDCSRRGGRWSNGQCVGGLQELKNPALTNVNPMGLEEKKCKESKGTWNSAVQKCFYSFTKPKIELGNSLPQANCQKNGGNWDFQTYKCVYPIKKPIKPVRDISSEGPNRGPVNVFDEPEVENNRFQKNIQLRQLMNHR